MTGRGRAAEAADAARERGQGGPLCGVPLTIKDSHWLAGVTAAAGSRAIVGLLLALVIGLTSGGATRPQRSSLAAMRAVEGAIVAVAATVLAISAHRGVVHRAEGLLRGLGAGALFGVSNVAIKFLTHAEGPIHGLLRPWTLTALIAGAISFTRPPAASSSDRPSR